MKNAQPSASPQRDVERIPFSRMLKCSYLFDVLFERDSLSTQNPIESVRANIRVSTPKCVYCCGRSESRQMQCAFIFVCAFFRLHFPLFSLLYESEFFIFLFLSLPLSHPFLHFHASFLLVFLCFLFLFSQLYLILSYVIRSYSPHFHIVWLNFMRVLH